MLAYQILLLPNFPTSKSPTTYVKDRCTMNGTKAGEESPSSTESGLDKDIPMDVLGDDRNVEATPRENDVSTAPNDAQAGVKNIEAVSMTWTKWGLIAAYARSVKSEVL